MEKIVFEDHEKLVIHMIKKTFRDITTAINVAKKRSMDLDDLIQVGNIALWESIGKFDESKGFSFTTFAAANIRYKLLNEVNKNHFIKMPQKMDSRAKENLSTLVSLHTKSTCEDEDIEEIGDLILSDYDIESDVVSRMEIEKYKSILNDREYKVFKLKLDKYTFKEIGEKIGSTERAAQGLFERLKNKIKQQSSITA